MLYDKCNFSEPSFYIRNVCWTFKWLKKRIKNIFFLYDRDTQNPYGHFCNILANNHILKLIIILTVCDSSSGWVSFEVKWNLDVLSLKLKSCLKPTCKVCGLKCIFFVAFYSQSICLVLKSGNTEEIVVP